MEANVNPMLSQGRATLDSTHSVVVERTLNEFVIFRKPGHYVIHCNSGRLMSGTAAKLESNSLALDILPRDEAGPALQKNFSFTERTYLQLRFESFNTLNHPNWDDPNTSLTSATFGQITNIRACWFMRELQLSLKLVF
jgi:hypothetical protein